MLTNPSLSLDQETRRLITDLRSPQAIRARCGQMFELAHHNQLPHFRCDLGNLPATAEYVLQATRTHYPDLQVPFHSRWRHFEIGSHPRLASLDQSLAEQSALERARIKCDLAITSVLLDAGAGASWQYQEPSTGELFRRSEGLAIASFDAFCNGLFSSNAANLHQADARGLQQLTEASLATAFQVTSENPLVGLAGRVALMQRLGETLERSPRLFGSGNPRPGYLVDYLQQQAEGGQLTASQVLSAVLEGFSDIWPGRIRLAGVNLGDVWTHPSLAGQGVGDQLVPFHKLSQWLTYSLLEPLQELGLDVTGIEDLTGLAEYRNGGLCLDLGLIQVKDPEILNHPHRPNSPVIVEWRALTVVLLDRIADQIRQTLGLSPAQFPLARVLQGGTWAAGRQIAAHLRPGGIPPIQIESDGTVF